VGTLLEQRSESKAFDESACRVSSYLLLCFVAAQLILTSIRELQSTSVESFLDKRKTCLFDIVTLRWMISSQTAKNHVESLFKLIGRKLESSGEDSIALISQMQLLVRSAGGFRQFVALCLRHGDSTGEMHLDDELHYWLDHNDIQTMQVLLECGANANAIRSTDSSRRTLLHLASKLNQLDVVHLLLMHHGNIKAQDSDKLTPLHIASIERNYSVILTLLEHGADPNAEDMLGQTPWLLFAQYTYYNGSRDASKMEDTRSALTSFLAHGADVNLKDPYHGRTVLHVVLAWQDFISAKILLEQPHLDLSITDGMGATTWLAFIRIYAIGAIGDFYALEDRISEVLGIFLSRGVDANMQTRDDNGRSLLHIACMRGNLVFVRTLLQNNADCASKDKEGLTPWQYFVDFYCYLKDHRTEEEDLMELIALFLARGADISAKGKADMTALHAASLSFHLDIIRELLEHGADARAERNDGFTPWQAFLKMYFWLAIDSADEMEKTIQELIKVFVHHGADITVASGDLRCTILHAASRANHESVAQYVLSQLSADHVNATDYHGCSPLHRVGSKSLAKLLLTHGANINARDEFGNTPLHLVGLVSRPPNMTFHVRLLLQHGADIEATNAFGSTPLHQAVYFGAVEAVQALLESGANAEAKDDGGQTPIQVARDRDKEDITRMLLEYGARDTD
jgi:ankyrin repeat protein